MRGGEYGFRSDGGGGDVARPVKFMGQPPDPSMNVFDDRFADGVEMMQPAGVLKVVSVDPRRDVGGERQLPGETIISRSSVTSRWPASTNDAASVDFPNVQSPSSPIATSPTATTAA